MKTVPFASYDAADTHGDYVRYAPRNHSIVVPPQVAAEIDKERQTRELSEMAAAAAEAATRTAQREAGDQVTSTTLSRNWQSTKKEMDDSESQAAYGAGHGKGVPEHAWESVDTLLDGERIRTRLAALHSGEAGDRDHVKREIALLTKAVWLGRTREIVMHKEWRARLADLAAEFPSFREAIKVISDAYALAEKTGRPPVIKALLLVSDPGLGKSLFCSRLAETLCVPSATHTFDAHSSGTELCGGDPYYSTARHGTIFELLGLGRIANPVIVLDELDKAGRSLGSDGVDMLAQLHSTLEPETARRFEDRYLGVRMDARHILYIACANGLAKIDAPLLSRFNVIHITMPEPSERREAARRIIQRKVRALGVEALVTVNAGCVVVLEGYTPRIICQTIDAAVAEAVAQGRTTICAGDVERALGIGDDRHRLGRLLH